MARAYKGLFEAAQVQAHEQRERALRAERELTRLRDILAVHAEKETIPEMRAFVNTTKAGVPIPLYPISYEAYRASLGTLKRWVDDEDSVSARVEILLFKDRKVVCVP